MAHKTQARGTSGFTWFMDEVAEDGGLGGHGNPSEQHTPPLPTGVVMIVTTPLATHCVYLMLFSRELNESVLHLEKEERGGGNERQVSRCGHTPEYRQPLSFQINATHSLADVGS